MTDGCPQMLTRRSTDIQDIEEKCAHLKKTVNMLPPKHRDCLEFLMFHLARVASRERENLVSLPFRRFPSLHSEHSANSLLLDVTQKLGCSVCAYHYERSQSRKRNDGHARQE